MGATSPVSSDGGIVSHEPPDRVMCSSAQTRRLVTSEEKRMNDAPTLLTQKQEELEQERQLTDCELDRYRIDLELERIEAALQDLMILY